MFVILNPYYSKLNDNNEPVLEVHTAINSIHLRLSESTFDIQVKDGKIHNSLLQMLSLKEAKELHEALGKAIEEVSTNKILSNL